MSAPVVIYVPRDAAALAMDADAVAHEIERIADERGVAVQVVRNGSRGLLWLEPLVEVATHDGRVAYGPVAPEDVAGLFDAGWLSPGNGEGAKRQRGEGSYTPSQALPGTKLTRGSASVASRMDVVRLSK